MIECMYPLFVGIIEMCYKQPQNLNYTAGPHIRGDHTTGVVWGHLGGSYVELVWPNSYV